MKRYLTPIGSFVRQLPRRAILIVFAAVMCWCGFWVKENVRVRFHANWERNVSFPNWCFAWFGRFSNGPLSANVEIGPGAGRETLNESNWKKLIEKNFPAYEFLGSAEHENGLKAYLVRMESTNDLLLRLFDQQHVAIDYGEIILFFPEPSDHEFVFETLHGYSHSVFDRATPTIYFVAEDPFKIQAGLAHRCDSDKKLGFRVDLPPEVRVEEISFSFLLPGWENDFDLCYNSVSKTWEFHDSLK